MEKPMVEVEKDDMDQVEEILSDSKKPGQIVKIETTLSSEL